MSSSCIAKPISNPLSLSQFTLFSPPSLSQIISYPNNTNKPTFKLNISCSFNSSISLRNKRTQFPKIVAYVSDWAQQEESAATVAEAEGEESGGLFSWSGEGEQSGGGEAAAEEEEYPEPPEEAKLFVGNLPYDVDSEKLAQLFEQAGVVEIAEVIYNRETDQSRGFGFVTMSTVEQAEKAVDMLHRYDVNGRFLTVNKAAPRGAARPERTPRVYEPSYRLYVGNLPWDVDDARLEQVFSEHGKVVNARVVYDRETGRSRGFGFVTMESESEQNDAIANLDGQELGGRAIKVNVAEDRPRRNSF